MTDFSISIERIAHEIPDYAELRKFERLGFTGARIWANGNAVNPERGVWDWGSTDAAITTAHEAGLEHVRLTLLGAPPYACNGQITYRPYTAGPQSWSIDHKGDAHPPAYFDPSLPWVKDPAHIDPVFMREFARRAVDRYHTQPIIRGETPAVEAFLCWNEPDDGNYWPPVAARPYDEAYDRYITEVLMPFDYGASLAETSAFKPGDEDNRPITACGPEVAYIDGLQRLLSHEAHQSSTPLIFDTISFHAYATTLTGWCANLDEVMAIVGPRRDGRAVAISEMGDRGGGWGPAAVRYATEMYDIAWINVHSKEDVLRDGEAWRKVIEECGNGKRRAVQA